MGKLEKPLYRITIIYKTIDGRNSELKPDIKIMLKHYETSDQCYSYATIFGASERRQLICVSVDKIFYYEEMY